MGARATCAIANRLAGELETVPTACSIKKIQNVDDINSCWILYLLWHETIEEVVRCEGEQELKGVEPAEKLIG